ncbi:TetR/AcrR family transcriptional regulator [Blastococcus sp. SYSU D00820]
MSREPSNRRRADTRRRIYLQAMDLFRQRGYEHVSVGDIATAAGISVPTFYAHFPSKEQIVLPLPRREEIDAVLAGQPAEQPVVDRIRGAMRAWLSAFQGPEREELLDRWRIVVSTPGLRNRAAEYERATAGLVVDALPEQGTELAAQLAVTLLLSAYTQILVHWAESDGRRELEEVTEDVLATLRRL